MKVCYLCFRAFSFARTTSITAGSMDMNIIAMINSWFCLHIFCRTHAFCPNGFS